jgi:hypothetical protein
MKTINIFKGQRIDNQQIFESITIIIDEELPRIEESSKELKKFFEKSDKQFNEQAEMLFNALHDSLPAGTLDRLLLKLLEMKKSHFIAPFGSKLV